MSARVLLTVRLGQVNYEKYSNYCLRGMLGRQRIIS